jgi:alanyl-tRNA synthetase
MTSAEIRQSFLDFFKSKGHTLVPSSSLMPDSPNLLFTNAGMNQFVPIFLGQRAPDVSRRAGVAPGLDTRAADTQKCIRAGGKHNDLEDVGLDTYHHTFFEMLGNWSFGDYFKNEAIAWAWELLTEVWRFPRNRLYATVYCPDKAKGEPSVFDQEAYDLWAGKFRAAGLDPKVHIVNGGKKDNFWMMGDTGPCGPCSEIHADLTPQGDTQGRLVNQASAECIEIWNLVFIQFNANPDGSFSPLPSRHVDTGMGFERVAGIIQNTKNFTDFNRLISNYETDIFRPLFDRIERLSGKQYGSTLPARDTHRMTEKEKSDIAFRVIADHVRTLSFAIADGILPSNEGRGYVLRRVLRRAVSYGRNLGLREPFLYKFVTVLSDTMGDTFPNVRENRDHTEEIIQREEEAFNLTLDKGLGLFDKIAGGNNLVDSVFSTFFPNDGNRGYRLSEVSMLRRGSRYFDERALGLLSHLVSLSDADLHVLRTQPERLEQALINVRENPELKEKAMAYLRLFPSDKAFDLYHTYGFPVDLTQLKARERGLIVNTTEVERLMEIERGRSRSAQKKEVIELSEVETTAGTQFVGYDKLETAAKVLEVVGIKDKTAVILDTSPLYAEMGGQVGDTGQLSAGGQLWRIVSTQKVGDAWLHFLEVHSPQSTVHSPQSTGQGPQSAVHGEGEEIPAVGDEVKVAVDRPRRLAIQRHHTATHLLHWALHQVVSKDATQKGSYVGPDKLTFDFSSAPLTPGQVADVERLVNERVLENAPVSWVEVKYSHIKDRPDIMQFFGEKYGDWVRVVQIGGQPTGLNGDWMELCGGTHVRATGEIGLFRIAGESAIAAGIRRIEALCGLEAYRRAGEELQLIRTLSAKVNSPVGELERKLESLLAQQKELEKQLKAIQQKQAAEVARGLAAKAQTLGSTPAIVENLGAADVDFLQGVADGLKGRFKGVVVLGGAANNAVALVATVSPEFTRQFQAGKLIQAIAPIVGGKGGGRPDNARGGGKDVARLDEALMRAAELIKG